MSTQEFAGYAITRNLPGGGLTRLYVALDTQQNRVVIRHLTPDSARSWRIRRSFLHSAEVMQKLHHPNIVRFFSIGRQGKVPFMVLEYVESRTLRDLILSRDPLLANNVLSLIRQMANGLAHIHAQKYLHLDFKPENILIRPNGSVVIIDFDLAIRSKRWRKKISQLPGTPSYIAPETLLKRTVDERSDIYSFGVCCYEMLSYHKPFEGDKIEQVRAAQVDPKIAPTRLKQHTPNVPVALEALILKCLAKNPDDRYPDMALVIRDLEALI